MVEFYPAELVARSRELWELVKAWGAGRDDVTALGGWATFELVDPEQAQQSKDVDLLFRSQAALDGFRKRMPEWNLVWRRKGRTTFKDCHFKDDSERRIVVDVFTTEPSIGAKLFAMQSGTNVKPAPKEGFLPSVEFLLRDKIETIPLRSGWDDPNAKRLKDFLDVRLLVFHNRAGHSSSELHSRIPTNVCERAAEHAAPLKKEFPEYDEELTQVGRWLRGA